MMIMILILCGTASPALFFVLCSLFFVLNFFLPKPKPSNCSYKKRM